ncbi:MAG: hypothetical protein SPL83_08650 [Succinivibrio sp.]|nr:hypothetical protein [Succinivibrio sp.]
MTNLFVTTKSIFNFFKDHTKEDFIFFANEETGVYSHSWKTQGNWETTVKHGLFRVWTRQKVFHSELRKEIEIEFAFNFAVPVGKNFTPERISENLNNLTNIVVKNFKVAGHSLISKLTSQELATVRNFSQKALQNYIMSNKSVYSQAVEALCTQRSYSFEEFADLEFSRYGSVLKQWREFRYKSCKYLFIKDVKENKFSKEPKIKFGARAFG